MPLDLRAFTLVNGEWTCAALDWWAALVRATEIWLVPALVLLGLVLWRGGPRARGAAVLVVLVFCLGDALVVRTAKKLIEHPRPAEVMTVRSVRLAPASPRILGVLEPLDIRPAGPRPVARSGRSFPSGHAYNAFGVATALALCYRRRGWLAFLPAAAVAYARVYAGLHWPSDVLVSALAAIPASLGLSLLLDALWRRVQPRLAARRRWARALPSLVVRPEPAAAEKAG